LIRILLLLILSAFAASAQTIAWLQSPWCTNGDVGPCLMVEPDSTYVSATAVRFAARVNMQTKRMRVQYGLSSGVYLMQVEQQVSSDVCPASGKPALYSSCTTGEELYGRSIRVSGLKPNTTYYANIFVDTTLDGSGQTLSKEISFTTGSVDPNEESMIDFAKPDTSYPTSFGSTHTAAADCSDLQSLLDTVGAMSTSVNRKVIIPNIATCTGTYLVRYHLTGPGYLVIEGSKVGTTEFPPEGVRVTPKYASLMPRIRSVGKSANITQISGTATSGAAIRISDGSKYIRFVGLLLENNPTLDNMVTKEANTCYPAKTTPVALTGCVDSGTNVVCSVASATGLVSGMVATVTGSTGMTGFNGSWPITVSGTTITFTGADGTGTYANDASFTIPNVSMVAGNGTTHNLAVGRTVTISNNSSISGLNGTYTIATSDLGNNLSLTGTGSLTGTSGTCNIGVLGDTLLSACRTGGGVIECDTALPHGLVNGTVVKVLSPTPDSHWTDYSGTYGFSKRTDSVTVVDSDTIRFTGTTPNGVYEGGARLMMDANNVAVSFWMDDTNNNDHIIFDRMFVHTRGYPYRPWMNVRFPAWSAGAIVDSYIEDNGQWSFTQPGTTTTVRALGWSTNFMNVNADHAVNDFVFHNNYIAFHLVGVGGSSNNGDNPIPNHHIYTRNTFEMPPFMRRDLSNPDWNGLAYDSNRTAMERKGVEYLIFEGNRVYGVFAGQDSGSGILMSARPNDGSAYANVLFTKNRIYGIRIRYNVIWATNPINVFGGNTSNVLNDTPTSKRIWISDNFLMNNWTRWPYNSATAPTGVCLSLDGEAVTLRNNVCMQRGPFAAFIGTTAKPRARWNVANNLFTFHYGMSSFSAFNAAPANSYEVVRLAETTLGTSSSSWSHFRNGFLQLGASTTVCDKNGSNCTSYAHLDPSTKFRNNVFLTGVEGTTLAAETSNSASLNASKGECDASMQDSGLRGLTNSTKYPGNICWDAGQSNGMSGVDTYVSRVAAIGFGFDRLTLYNRTNEKSLNMKLRPGSAFKSGWTLASNALCSLGLCAKSSDGSDLGPDVEKAKSALGVVDNVHVHSLAPTTATVGYYAPDAAACYVDYWPGTSTTPTPSTLRVSDGGGNRKRNVVLTPITAGQQYQIIVQCAVEQPTGTIPVSR
jgi:hypothetical protein